MFRTYFASLTKGEKRLRILLLAFSWLAALVTVPLLITQGEYIHLRMCALTLVLALLPAGVEIVGRFRLHPAFYVVGAVYALTPLLGECYKLYYTTAWWDKFMHGLGGVVFALFGFYLFRALIGADDTRKRRWAAALFAFFFSVTIAVLWEFVEYTGDRLFNMDMQHDAVVSEIHSYQLGERPGDVGHRTDITATTVNGEPLPVEGYLDIGLHDTMGDMMVETFGAALAVAVYAVARGRLRLFLPLGEE